jgi:hypothetical protein
MNIGSIANLNAGSERVGRTGQSMYKSIHDIIRTQILNWSESGRNCKME